MTRGILLSVSLLLAAGMSVLAQDTTSFTFHKISTTDFEQQAPAFDAGADAVVLGDSGSLSVISGWRLGYEFTRKKRVKILRDKGVEAGKFEIPIYMDNDGDKTEEIISLKGTTYNVENGKITETSFDLKDIYTEKISNRVHVKKFALPKLKAGAIFEISFTIRSFRFGYLRPWNFQEDYPCLWSAFDVEVPALVDFAVMPQGYLPYYFTNEKEYKKNYLIPGHEVSSNVVRKKWVIRDIPSISEQSYTTTIDNHRSAIRFQLSAVRWPDSKPEMILDTWPKLKKDLDEDSRFGGQFREVKGTLNKILQPLMGAEAMFRVDRARKIYNYVRDNYICLRRSGIYCSFGLKDMLKTKSGNLAEINLLLIAMLREQLIDAEPVILSTRSNGLTNQVYPLMDRFNYVICHTKIDGKDYYLDASSPDLGFGKLDIQCYNGHARILYDDPQPVFLRSDSIEERKVAIATLQLANEKLNAKVTVQNGYFRSLHYREQFREKKVNWESVIKNDYGADSDPVGIRIDSLQKFEEPVTISYNVSTAVDNNQLLYVKPVLVPFFKENPFVSDNRFYPVELPYKMDMTYLLTMEIPKGYAIEELPKSSRVALNEKDGQFEFIISHREGRIQLRSRFVLYKATFDPEEYESLREFFGYVVKKQQEQIVLRIIN